MNLKKVKVELRVCVSCRFIFGCYLFGQKMLCQDCFINQCEIRGVRIADKGFIELLELRKISISGGICQKCEDKRQEKRSYDVQSSHIKSLAQGEKL